MAYLQLLFPTSRDEAEQLADTLEELNALAITLEDAQDQPLFQLQPQEMPLWETVEVKALFPENISVDEVIGHLAQLIGSEKRIDYHSEIIEDQDWVRLTQQHFKPQCYANHLWICPSWHTEPLEGNVLHIDPGLAFGTGTHPTTSLCLDWLAHHPIKNKVVVDYGCGSGILALAALVLGATTVYAVDHDEQALLATKNNAALNKKITAEQIIVCYPEQLPDIKADVVMANILSEPLITLEPTLRNLIKPNGVMILSGLLEQELPKILAVYEKQFIIDEITICDGWARVVVELMK